MDLKMIRWRRKKASVAFPSEGVFVWASSKGEGLRKEGRESQPKAGCNSCGGVFDGGKKNRGLKGEMWWGGKRRYLPIVKEKKNRKKKTKNPKGCRLGIKKNLWPKEGGDQGEGERG